MESSNDVGTKLIES